MEFLKYGAITVLALGALFILIFCVRSGRPLRFLFLNALIALIFFIVIDLTSVLTGVHIPVNGWTAAGSALYGIPALCGFLILQVIFK